MTTEITIKILEGYNQEKSILSTRLSNLGASNHDLRTASEIRDRLGKIDKQISLIATKYSSLFSKP